MRFLRIANHIYTHTKKGFDNETSPFKDFSPIKRHIYENML